MMHCSAKLVQKTPFAPFTPPAFPTLRDPTCPQRCARLRRPGCLQPSKVVKNMARGEFSLRGLLK